MRSVFLCITLALSALVCADHHEASPQVLIEAKYNQYIRDFIAKDYEAIASHFNPPIQRTTFEGSLVLETKEEIVAMYQNMMANIQEGYSYSEIDSIDIQAMSSTTYAADFNFTRYNASNEAVFGGRSIYLFGKQSGAWKMFSMIQAERE